MSARDILASIPGQLAHEFGQSAIQWRPASGGSYRDLDDAYQGPVSQVYTFDQERQREIQRSECTITVPYTSQVLALGYRVKTSDDLEWAIEEIRPNAHHGLYAYVVRRDPLIRYVGDRKATP